MIFLFSRKLAQSIKYSTYTHLNAISRQTSIGSGSVIEAKVSFQFCCLFAWNMRKISYSEEKSYLGSNIELIIPKVRRSHYFMSYFGM